MPAPPENVVRLLWAPKSLGRLAVGCSFSAAAFFGISSCTLEVIVPAAITGASLTEPYPDLRSFLLATVRSLLRVVVVCALPAVGLFLTAIWPWFRWAQPTSLDKAKLRVLLLAPVTALLPFLAWVGLYFFATVADPGFGIVAGKPAWLAWGNMIPLLGSCFAWCAGALLVAWNITLAFRYVATIYNSSHPPRCRECGYLLIGLLEARCPECATAFDPAVLQNAADPDESDFGRTQ